MPRHANSDYQDQRMDWRSKQRTRACSPARWGRVCSGVDQLNQPLGIGRSSSNRK